MFRAAAYTIARRAAITNTSRAVFQRHLATEAPSTASPTPSAGKLLLNFALPHQTLMKNVEITQINITSSEGDMGILADHVPMIAQLVPGLVEIFQGADKSKKFFVSGGFAIINPDSTLNINAVEAVPLEQIDFAAARRNADEANRKIAASGASELDKAAAKAELEVYEALVAAEKSA
ncbi:hypothetical protein SeMB42_g01864 [Synchytrium endobioticum]|uniref:ATP synthase subunit delta, mitochondrial n=1 Tax=Synchytrium endobioticum TaxID=286115 RepID=A0A507DIZ5_9FUNG|nr:hypothetical protein SeLEV6574_g03083 [Synchytrium endobioticum]TPX51573.1 hypothetical protein SeMB42_g01864 [Synchytrium endobioticum]